MYSSVDTRVCSSNTVEHLLYTYYFEAGLCASV